MSFQKNDQSDFDFSIIDKKPPQQAKLNFSVQSLLSEHQRSTSKHQKSQHNNRNNVQQSQNINEGQQIAKIHAQNGSFLKDLQKLQQQLSFQTQLYNVYQQETQTFNSNSLNPLTKSYLHAKSNSHLKTTKEQSNNQPTQNLDDYGYLVLDFTTKRKKSSKLNDHQKYNPKLYTQGNTSSANKLKNSRSSHAFTQKNSEQDHQILKSHYKKSSLNRLLSDKKSPKQYQPIAAIKSKQKFILKTSTTKCKDLSKQIKCIVDKVSKKLSKNKSPITKYNYESSKSKNTNISTTIGQTTSKTNKSSTKSMRQGNAYSQYYGFEDIGASDRLITKSNCFSSSGSQKNLRSSNKNYTKVSTKKSSSKSKCKLGFHSPSPSNKDLQLRFKKKKPKQIK